MSDYLPKYAPGTAITSTTSAAVTGGQLLEVSGSGTVAPTAGATADWLGVATQDAASGALVGVLSGGVQRLTASGAITAGDQVVAAAAGAVATLPPATTAVVADINAARQVVGIALTTVAAGALVEIKMAR